MTGGAKGIDAMLAFQVAVTTQTTGVPSLRNTRGTHHSVPHVGTRQRSWGSIELRSQNSTIDEGTCCGIPGGNAPETCESGALFSVYERHGHEPREE